METSKKNQQSANDATKSQTSGMSSTEDAVEADGTPVLDEKDLEENNLTVEEAENIEWEGEDELEDAALADTDEEEDEEEE